MNMQELVDKLNKWTVAYDKGTPEISDEEWDNYYFQLKKMEEESGTILPDSPTQKIYFKTVSKLNKVKHNHPMLSLDKTKDINDVISFLGDKSWIAMCKMDGLTCSLHYVNGELVGAETRGNGEIGEDVLHNAKIIPSIPNHINMNEEMIVDGEIICTYENFKEFEEEYKNPRNFASGSIRLLNSKECSKRHLTFVAWDVIKGFSYEYTLSAKLMDLSCWGFTVVPSITPTYDNLMPETAIKNLKEAAKSFSYPIDGVVFKYNDISEYQAAGRTDHHFKGGLAYKFYDDTYSTRLNYIEWTMGRTGVLTPVAVFDPIDIERSICSRASLHNISVMKDILGDCAYNGEPLEIFKANMIIPQVKPVEEEYRHTYGYVIAHGGVSVDSIPERCPVCGGEVIVRDNDGVKTAYCNNPECEGKLLNRVDHFLGKKGLDVKGISKMTLDKLMDWGWINNITDVYKLQEHRNEWINKAGFGVASVDKILAAIEESKNSDLDKFIAALGIPEIGSNAAKKLANVFNTYEDFRAAIMTDDDRLYKIDGIGEIMIQYMRDFDYTESDELYSFMNIVPYRQEEITTNNSITGKTFVITGKLTRFKNRVALKRDIESHGGKVTESVSKNTDYLINNDIKSTSTKNKKALDLNIPIINEDEYCYMASSH